MEKSLYAIYPRINTFHYAIGEDIIHVYLHCNFVRFMTVLVEKLEYLARESAFI